MKKVWQVCWHLEFAYKPDRAAGIQRSFLQSFQGGCVRCHSVKCYAASHCVGAISHHISGGVGMRSLGRVWPSETNSLIGMAEPTSRPMAEHQLMNSSLSATNSMCQLKRRRCRKCSVEPPCRAGVFGTALGKLHLSSLSKLYMHGSRCRWERPVRSTLMDAWVPSV